MSSPLKALETVSFNSLFLPPNLVSLFSFCELSPFNLLVALCSASFLFSKSEEIEDGGFERFDLFGVKLFCTLFSIVLDPLEKFDFAPNLGVFFFYNDCVS